jgi:ABC-type amino acid transport substrate-binding protein
MKLKTFKCLLALFLSVGLLFAPTHAEEKPPISMRMNMGYYFNSISDVANRTDIEVSLNFWAEEVLVEEAMKHNFIIGSSQTLLFDRMEDMQQAFQQGQLDLIAGPPLLLAQYFKKEELRDGFVGVREGKKTDKLILITRNDKKINSVKDLRGKHLGMIENDELTDIFLDTLTLKQLRKTYKDVARSVQLQKKNSHLILDIFFGRIDAGVVYISAYETMAELNPDVKNKLKILNEFPIKGRNFSYFRRDYPLTDILTRMILLELKNNPRGKLILEIFKTAEIDYCKTEELDVFSTLYKDYLQLKQRQKK